MSENFYRTCSLLALAISALLIVGLAGLMASGADGMVVAIYAAAGCVSLVAVLLVGSICMAFDEETGSFDGGYPPHYTSKEERP